MDNFDSTTQRPTTTAVTAILSPPVTPKLQMDSFHDDGWDSSSTTSSSASSIECVSATSARSYCSKRKQRPMQSLPKSTKGAFYMPTFMPTTSSPPTSTKRAITTQWMLSSNNQEHLPQKKRKHLYPFTTKETNPKSKPSEKLPFNTSIMTNNTIVLNNEEHKVRPQNEEESIAKEQSNQPHVNNGSTLATECIQSEGQQLERSHLPSSDPTQQQQEDDAQTIKKAKTSAAYIYDNLTADTDQSVLFANSEEWIPSLEVFDRRPTVRISWKGSPLKIRNMPYFEKLHAGEVSIAATLRLTPEQYLKCKWALVLAAKEASENNTLFRKSEAQKVCCIDVNKTSVLWNAFGKLGWLGSKWPQ